MTTSIHDDIGCNWDEDGNGLDDDVEAEIARCLAPVFDLDPAENVWPSADDPKILWTITRTATNSSTATDISIVYAFLSAKDGGFATDGSAGCDNEHDGDSGQVNVTAQIERGTSWYVRLRSVTADGETRYASQLPLMRRVDAHPVVYPSAGKHHLYMEPGVYPAGTNCWVTTCQCRDSARGGTRIRTDKFQTFKHAMNPSVLWDRLPPIESVDLGGFSLNWWQLMGLGLSDGDHWLNMCALFHSGERRQAQRLQKFHLNDIGVPGTYAKVYASSSENITPPAIILGPRRPDDTDGDGLSDLGHLEYESVSVLYCAEHPDQCVCALDACFSLPTPIAPVDRCPLGSEDGAASDADGLLGDCDPAPRFYSPYVGGGSPRYPATSSAPQGGPLPVLTWHWPAGGFLDWDQDGVPEGADMCPTMPDSQQNTNTWGERYNWSDWGDSNVLNYKLGSFTRGNACDPYPVAIPSRTKGGQSGGSSSGMCVKPGWRTGGQDEIEIQQSASIGISHNDPRAKDKSLSFYPPPPESVWTQSFRCACRGGFDGNDCVAEADSDCFRGDAVPADDFTPQTAGRRWRPVDRCADGERDEHSFCRPYRIATPYFGMLLVSQDARLVHDQLGSSAALVDLEGDTVFGFEPALRTWIASKLPEDQTMDRDSAALALVGSKLLAVGEQGDVLQVDIHGGGATVMPLGLPVRKGAHLILSGNGRELVYAGGFGDGDAPHDDVWAVDVPVTNDGWKPARLVRSDTGTRSPLHDAGAVVAAPFGGERLRAWSVTAEDGAGIIQPYERLGSSWATVDLEGAAELARCDDTDAVGGRACELSDAWWATPGTTACEAAPQPGACQGVAGQLGSVAVINASERVLTAVPDDASVWVLTQANLTRYTLSDGATSIQNAVKLPARGRAIAVQRNEVLLATDAGVHLVTVKRGEISIGKARPLCGRPVHMAPIGGTLWAVSTSLGLAVVSSSGSAIPTVLSMSGVVPSGKGSADAQPLPLDELGNAACASLDRMLDDESIAWMTKATPLAAVSSQRLLSAHGPFLVDVDISNPSAPTVRQAMRLKTVLRSLRVDDAGQFAYGTGDGASDSHRPVLDLRGGALALSGQHGLTDWVERKDGVTLAVRATSPRRVEVAKVVR